MVEMSSRTAAMKAVTVHRGARDSYQVARALAEAGILEKLVTDLYWPADRGWAHRVEQAAPNRVGSALRCRSAAHLESDLVESRWVSGICSLLAHKASMLPSSWQSRAIRWCDQDLGRRAGEIATEKQAALLSYSYYGHSSFSNYRGSQRILFQLHPHPSVVRSILRRERELHPDCASSLDKEWELMLPEEDFERLVEEVRMADHWIVASHFTKQTLVETGIPKNLIEVIPYGIELDSFRCKEYWSAPESPLKLLFVGTIAQRKGIKYLLQALAQLPPGSVELTVCGRPVDDMALFRDSGLPAIKLFPSINAKGLRQAYREADVFVLPSVAEGFGQVLLEAMASGLPIIGTDRTAAPDLIQDGREGTVINAGDPEALAQAIRDFLRNRNLSQTMGRAARQRAEYFTWARFRKRIATFVGDVTRQKSANESLPCSSR